MDCGGGLQQRHALAACNGVWMRWHEIEEKQWPGVMIMTTFQREDHLFSVLCALRTVHYACPQV